MNVAKMYDDVSERYQKLVDDSHYVGPRWISGKLKNLPIEQGSALDLACATGSIGHVVKNHYPDLTIHGLDISSKMVDKARQTNLYQSARFITSMSHFPLCLSKPLTLSPHLVLLSF